MASRILAFALAGVAFAAALFFGRFVFSHLRVDIVDPNAEMTEMIELPVALKNIRRWTELCEPRFDDLVGSAKFPKSFVAKDAIQDRETLRGKWVYNGLSEGEYFTESDFRTEVPIPEGYVVFTISQFDNLSPGDRVSIHLDEGEKNGEPRSTVLLQHVLFLHVSINPRKDAPNDVDSLVAVTPEQKCDLLAAQRRGKLKVILEDSQIHTSGR